MNERPRQAGKREMMNRFPGFLTIQSLRSGACLVLGFMISLVVLSNAAAAGTQRITSPEALAQALPRAKAGSVLVLDPGQYGVLSLRGLSTKGQVTLRSAKPSAPARFSGMMLRDVQGLTIENVVFDYDFQSGDVLSQRPFQVLKSARITISNSVFDGDLARGLTPIDNGFPTAFGLVVRGSKQITLTGNEIHNFYRGAVISQTSDVVVKGNDLHTLRMDGFNFAEVTGVRIEQNYIHDFARNLKSKDHSDMIQFWTASTNAPSRDIVIRHNVLNSGNGWYTQSIFMRNEKVDTGQAGADMFYRNIVIEQNVIINAHAHGITVGETRGLKVRNNSVLRNPRSEGKKKSISLWSPRIAVAASARDVVIESNVTSSIIGPEQQRDWRVDNNVIVQDHSRGQAGFYTAMFENPLRGNPKDLRRFFAKKGSAVAQQKAGAARLRPE